MKVAVTGASGFIGRHVVARLAARGVSTVAACHRHVDGFPPNVHVVAAALGDLDDPMDSLGHPDVLLHLAWEGLPNYGSPRHMEVELPAQERFLRACLDGGLKRLVVTGTCYEYGLQQGQLDESTPAQPVTPYGQAKDELRKRIRSVADTHGATLAWARLFYLFGPGQAATSLYAQLNAAIDAGQPSLPMSGGEQVRDFLPIGEAADILAWLALDTLHEGIVNVCSGRPVTVRELATHWVRDRNAALALDLGKYPYSTVEPMAFWGSRKKLDRWQDQAEDAANDAPPPRTTPSP